jgi:hypothetical protein
VHYICPQGQETIFQVVDTAGKFKQTIFKKQLLLYKQAKVQKIKNVRFLSLQKLSQNYFLLKTILFTFSFLIMYRKYPKISCRSQLV